MLHFWGEYNDTDYLSSKFCVPYLLFLIRAKFFLCSYYIWYDHVLLTIFVNFDISATYKIAIKWDLMFLYKLFTFKKMEIFYLTLCHWHYIFRRQRFLQRFSLLYRNSHFISLTSKICIKAIVLDNLDC